VDAIVTDVSSISAHLIGRKAKQCSMLRVLPIFGDLWSQNLAQGNDLVRLLERPVDEGPWRDGGCAGERVRAVGSPAAGMLSRQIGFTITNGFEWRTLSGAARKR